VLAVAWRKRPTALHLNGAPAHLRRPAHLLVPRASLASAPVEVTPGLPQADLSPQLGPSPEKARLRRGRPAPAELAAVAVLAVGCAAAFFHAAWQHPYGTQVGGAGDADEYAWFLSWVPFAIGHGLDPLVSTYVNHPNGVNLMWNTSVLLPSLLASPFTLLFGPAFSYNILATAAPALTVIFSHIAFRRWVGRLPAFAGAMVSGFSPYMVAQSAGHLAQMLIMSAPVFLIILDRALAVQAGQPWKDGLALGLVAWAQLLTGEEILAIEAVTAAIGIAVLYGLSRREAAPHLRYATRAIAVAAGSFAVLAAPFLAVQFAGPYKVENAHPYNRYVTDLLNFVVPTNITKLGGATAAHLTMQFTGNGSEDGGYLGIPLILFIAAAVFLARKRRVTWVALGAGAGAALLSMGPSLHVGGHVTAFPLPESLLQHMPFFHNLLPDRFASMMTVAAGLLIALGCDELRHLRLPAALGGWGLSALGLAALFPITNFPAAMSPWYWAFDTGLSCPKPVPATAGAKPPVVLLVPAINETNLRWQAEANFCFALPTARGMTGTNRADRNGRIEGQGVLLTLGEPGQPLLPYSAQLRREAADEISEMHLSGIVVGPEAPTFPTWTPQGQAEAVVWLEWLLGEEPRQSHDAHISYIWADLPPVAKIASGEVGHVPGAGPT
jgi:hypothetical protein